MCGLLLKGLPFALLCPALVLFGGSTSLINWGPGLLIAGLACLMLLDKDRHALRDGKLHSCCFLGLLCLMWIRAGDSEDACATANNTALLSLAAAGYLIGRMAGVAKSRALLTGLSLVLVLNFSCTLLQLGDREWNLIYPRRDGGFPSGLFAHYNYSAAFCLGSGGLLVCGGLRERGWLRTILLTGAACALVSVPLSLSRGGTLALAVMVAMAGVLLMARAFLTSGKSMLAIWLPAAALPALVLVAGNSLVPLLGRSQNPMGFYDDSVRISFWRAAAELSTNHPWLGSGAGSFAGRIYHAIDGLTAEPTMVHNEAMQVAVEYGYPALFCLALIIAVPLILSVLRVVNREDASHASFAAAGLMAMLFQSNFDFVFHTSPGAFIAALVLGEISRNIWPARSGHAVGRSRQAKTGNGDPRFLHEVKTLVDRYSRNQTGSLAELVALLSRSKDEQWRRASYRLTYWSKIGDEDALLKAVKDLRNKCSITPDHLSQIAVSRAEEPSATARGLGFGIFRNLALAGYAVALVLPGVWLSLALYQAWVPLYQPQRLSITKRFESLLVLVERNPGLGIDRKVLAAAWDGTYQFKSQAAREFWASIWRGRILRAVPGWRTDPGGALLLADLVGWAGDSGTALSYYNHAIKLQGNNERLFMAHAYKGQYLYELCISAAAVGEVNLQKLYAKQAVECFKMADAGMRDSHEKLLPDFAKMQAECEMLWKIKL